MDNQFSQATLLLPTVPADFAAKAGNSKEDFARAFLDLLSGTQVKGINVEQPQNFDLSEIQNRLSVLEKAADALVRRQRTVTLDGIANGVMVIPFEDIGTTSYMVNLIFITPGSNINTVTWGLVDGSKTNSQCSVYIDGDASPYKVQLQITELK